MRIILGVLLFSTFLFTACSDNKAQIEIIEAFPALSFVQPVDIQAPKDGSNRIFVLSQPGTIHVFENKPGAAESKIFLDIQSKVVDGGERGLLGLAFHPGYKENGFFFLDYTTGSSLVTRISRFKVSESNPDLADPASELILLEVAQPYNNHNGGQISFGPDGYLYVSFGDGGSGGDPQNNAQNLSTYLGKIIRIDVDNPSGGKNYGIPPGNPFAGNNKGYLEEIYAYGLRNVWRFSFDNQNRLWAADVGQNKWEEIDLIEKGKNYGWRIMEGYHCYNPSSNCDQQGLELPIWEYFHDSDGGYSITGGFVYNSSAASELIGKYIYGDFVSGNFWALTYSEGNVSNELIKSTDYAVSTFGIDENKELHFANYANGKIYKFDGSPSTDMGEILPNGIELLQNYPNPFGTSIHFAESGGSDSPSTTIKFSFTPSLSRWEKVSDLSGEIRSQNAVQRTKTEEPVKVSLKVYNILGREIETLVNELKVPGIYEVLFDGSDLSSGVYLYGLTAGTQSKFGKMILLR